MSVIAPDVLPPAQLFKQCRYALGMTVREMQDALCILDASTVIRIERGAIDVQGPTWVALSFLLDERYHDIQEKTADGDPVIILGLFVQVDRMMQAIRETAATRRQEARERQAARDHRDNENTRDGEGNALVP